MKKTKKKKKKLKMETFYWISLTNSDPILLCKFTSFAFHVSVVWST